MSIVSDAPRTGQLVALLNRTLCAPIPYEIRTAEPGNWVLWCARFSLWGSGGSLNAALTELTDSLAAMFQDYSYDDETNLGPDAISMKHHLQYLMGTRDTDSDP